MSHAAGAPSSSSGGPERRTMQAVRVQQTGADPVVTVDEVAVTDPGPGQVRVTVGAAGLCYADVLMSLGMYPRTPSAPFTLGYDVTGRVDAVGAGVTGLVVGQHVTGLSVRGALARHCVVDAARVVPTPDGLDPALTAALPLNYVTAHQMLVRLAEVRRGETVLVHGAAGGVGQAVLDLATELGVTVLGVSRGERLERVRASGGTPVDRDGDVVAQVRGLTGGQGADVVLDPVGGAHVVTSRECLAPGGRLVTFGYQSAALEGSSIAATYVKQRLRVAGWRLVDRSRRVLEYSVADRAAALPRDYADDLALLVGLLAAGTIAPVVEVLDGLDPVPAALERVRAGGALGKLVARLP